MSDFIRPKAREALWRWREAIVAGLLAVLGLWLASGFGVVRWLGIAFIIASGALAMIGAQRARFRGDTDGPGVISADEQRLSYFGPLTGGVVAIEDIRRVAHDGSGKPAHWVISGADEELSIPITASGTDALFDAFTALPGVQIERVLAARHKPGVTVVWER